MRIRGASTPGPLRSRHSIAILLSAIGFAGVLVAFAYVSRTTNESFGGEEPRNCFRDRTCGQVQSLWEREGWSGVAMPAGLVLFAGGALAASMSRMPVARDAQRASAVSLLLYNMLFWAVGILFLPFSILAVVAACLEPGGFADHDSSRPMDGDRRRLIGLLPMGVSAGFLAAAVVVILFAFLA